MPKMVLLMPTLVLMTLAAGFQLALKESNLGAHQPEPRLADRVVAASSG